MNYRDIEYQVLSRTDSLKAIPHWVVRNVLSRSPLYSDEYIRKTLTNQDFLRSVQVPHSRIESLTHSFRYTNSRDFYHVCTVQVDDNPAFFFIHLMRPSTGTETKTFILSKDSAKLFIAILTDIALEGREGCSLANLMVDRQQQIPELLKYEGVEIEYEHLGGTCGRPTAIEFEC